MTDDDDEMALCGWCDEPEGFYNLGPLIDGYHERCRRAADEFLERVLGS